MHPRNSTLAAASDTDIAIVGMVVRLPQARTVDEFWQRLTSATECITIASDDDLRRVTANALDASFVGEAATADVRERHFGWVDA